MTLKTQSELLGKPASWDEEMGSGCYLLQVGEAASKLSILWGC